jgi:hypothetical protein
MQILHITASVSTRRTPNIWINKNPCLGASALQTHVELNLGILERSQNVLTTTFYRPMLRKTVRIDDARLLAPDTPEN